MLGLDSKLHPSNRQRMLNEDLTQFMHSLSQATTILSDVRQPEVGFFIFGRWFCPNFQSNRLYRSKEAKQYKFYIVKAY